MKIAPLVILILFVGCGDSDTAKDDDALLSGSVAGTYDGAAFEVASGVLGKTQGVDVIALSDGDLTCATLAQQDPPKGNYAAIVVPSVAVGAYNNVTVQMYQNHGTFQSAGSASASLGISLVAPEKLGGTLSYSDTITGKSYALNGTFEVKRCP